MGEVRNESADGVGFKEDFQSFAGGLQVCERLLMVANTVEHKWKAEDVEAAELRLYVQQQLVTADVPGVAGTWGGDPNELCPPPRLASFKTSESHQEGLDC